MYPLPFVWRNACTNSTVESCPYTVPDKVVTGDDWHGPTHGPWCRQEWLNNLASIGAWPEQELRSLLHDSSYIQPNMVGNGRMSEPMMSSTRRTLLLALLAGALIPTCKGSDGGDSGYQGFRPDAQYPFVTYAPYPVYSGVSSLQLDLDTADVRIVGATGNVAFRGPIDDADVARARALFTDALLQHYQSLSVYPPPCYPAGSAGWPGHVGLIGGAGGSGAGPQIGDASVGGSPVVPTCTSAATSDTGGAIGSGAQSYIGVVMPGDGTPIDLLFTAAQRSDTDVNALIATFEDLATKYNP